MSPTPVQDQEIIPPGAPLAVRLQKRSRRLFWCGLAILGVGFVALIAPSLATIAVELIVAWTLLLVGVAGLVFAWSARSGAGWRLMIIPGLLALIGLLFLVSPGTGARVLTILLMIAFTLEGIASLAVGFALRRTTSRGLWLIVSGAVSLLIALLIAFGWPSSASWAIGLLVGVNFITTGAALTGIAAALRATASAVR